MTERRVYIAQLVCPWRHSMLGVAGEYDTAELAEEELSRLVTQMFKDKIAGKVMRPSCTVCGSDDLRIEIGQTEARTMEEAQPELSQEMMRTFWKTKA